MTKEIIRVAYLVSHLIQYQAPMLRALSNVPGIELTVFFRDDFSAFSYRDEGFQAQVQWDVDFLSGYRHQVIGVDHGGFFRRIHPTQFDVFITHGYTDFFQMKAILRAKLTGVPVFVRGESNLLFSEGSQFKKWFRPLFFRLLSRCVSGALAIGQLNQEFYLYYDFDPSRIYLTPYSVDNDYFQSQHEKLKENISDVKMKLSLDPSRQVILYASKLQERKHAADVLDAYVALCAALSPAQCPYLLIVGDGECMPHLKNQVKSLGLKWVRFFGFQNQSALPAFYAICDVFVLPSERENWGLVINEVMNSAKPVIVSDQVGCAPDLVRSGENGYVFSARDTQALCEALKTLILDDRLAKAMGEKSLEIIREWGISETVQGIVKACVETCAEQKLLSDNLKI